MGGCKRPDTLPPRVEDWVSVWWRWPRAARGLGLGVRDDARLLMRLLLLLLLLAPPPSQRVATNNIHGRCIGQLQKNPQSNNEGAHHAQPVLINQ